MLIARRRGGLTLVEMVVALSLTGIMLAMVAGISLRQQRIFADLTEQNAVTARLREASSILPIQLRSASPLDIRDASDTAVELRATIATAIVCDTIASALVLAPVADRASSNASFIAPVEAGDSAWMLTNDANGEHWQGYAIAATGTRQPGPCAGGGPVLTTTELHATRATLAFLLPPKAIGAPIRVTRALRYNLYRASDGGWFIGQRDWNNVDGRFNTVQPVAGPYLTAAAGGLVFRYADSTGTWLPSPVVDRPAIAMIQVQLRGQTTSATRILASSGTSGPRMDSTMLTIAFRNRP